MHILAEKAVTGGMQFSNVGTEVLSSVIHLLGVSLLSYMLAIKLSVTEIVSFRIINFSWPRLLVILNIIDSWAFMFTTGVLVHGTGMELSGTICLLGILNCIIFYVSSKILIYSFLIEKVYVVWNGRRQRWRSKVYMGCIAMLGVYVGVVVFLVLGRIAYFREDGACVIGLTRAASLTLLIYDLLINIVLTGLFVWPLLKRQFTVELRRVAIRTLWAAAVALTTSCINILVLTIMHGQQLAWVCLSSCGTDVVVNAAILCWVTSGNHDREHFLREPSSHGEPSKGYISNIVLYPTSPVSGENAFSRARVVGSSDLPSSPSFRGRASRIRHGGKGVRDDLDLESVSEVDSKPGATLEFADEVRGMGPVPPSVGLRSPIRAHSSTMKRSNTALMRHANGQDLQIIVTKETDVVTDEIPAPPLSKSPSPPDSKNNNC